MSYFFGRDIWDEMDRVNDQIADLMRSQDDMDDDYYDDDEEDEEEVMVTPEKKKAAADKKAVCAQGKTCKDVKAKKPDSKAMDGQLCFFPSADVVEKEKEYVVALDIPGVKKEDIKIDLQGDKICVSGSRKQRYMKEDEKGQMLSCKCSYGEFQRMFSLPEGCKPEDVAAKMEDGILYLTIAKPQKPEPKRITVM